jgi:tripartite-type tricarboxylate transporter receptor subunit TctC
VKTLADNGLVPLLQSPEEFARIVKADWQRWQPIVKASGFSSED